MKQHLYYFDIYPKVFPIGAAQDITVRPLSDKRAFPEGEYRISVMALNAGSPSYDIARGNRADFDLTPDEDGYLRFTFTAP